MSEGSEYSSRSRLARFGEAVDLSEMSDDENLVVPTGTILDARFILNRPGLHGEARGWSEPRSSNDVVVAPLSITDADPTVTGLFRAALAGDAQLGASERWLDVCRDHRHRHPIRGWRIHIHVADAEHPLTIAGDAPHM